MCGSKGEDGGVRADDDSDCAELLLGLLRHGQYAAQQTQGQRLAFALRQQVCQTTFGRSQVFDRHDNMKRHACYYRTTRPHRPSATSLLELLARASATEIGAPSRLRYNGAVNLVSACPLRPAAPMRRLNWPRARHVSCAP